MESSGAGVLGVVRQGFGAVPVHVAVLAEREGDLCSGGRDGGAFGGLGGRTLDQGARLLGLSRGEADLGIPDQEVRVVRVQAEPLQVSGLGFRQAAFGAKRRAQDVEHREERAVLGEAVPQYVDGLGVAVQRVQGGATEEVRAVVDRSVTPEALEFVEGALGAADLKPVAGQLEAGFGRFVHSATATSTRINASAIAPPTVTAMPGPHSDP